MSSFLAPRIPVSRFLLWCLAAFLFLAAPGCGEDEDPPSVLIDDTEQGQENDPAQGTVIFLQMEGGFHGVVGDDGTRWDPMNLPDTLAIDSVRVSFHGEPRNLASHHMWGQPMELIEITKIADPPPINLEPFRELARNASCADIRNRLFLIDRQLVFWDRQSNCSDAAFAHTLYGRRPTQPICNLEDTIAGPREWCLSAGPYRYVFSTIIANLDQPDLGLGPGRVKPIDF